MTENQIGSHIVQAAFGIHKHFGPGLLERTYHRLMIMELEDRNLTVESEKSIALTYKGRIVDENAYYADLLVEKKVIIELKSVSKLDAVHFKQVLTYLRLADLKLGYLINFNSSNLKEGIKRIMN